MINNHQR
jgi:hypothetical protein